MTLSRRDMLKLSAGAGAFLALGGGGVGRALGGSGRALQESELIRHTIPSSGQEVPAIGIGMRNYRTEWAENGIAEYRRTIEVFHGLGGEVLDTAPGYGDSESVLGGILADLGIREDLFIATKVDRQGRQEGIDRMEASLEKIGTDHVDLMQVHNLRDAGTQLETMRAWKEEGRIRHVGVTTSSDRQYEELEGIMRDHDLDFVQVDYSLGNRSAAERILPLARDRGMATLINLPFGRGRLFEAVGDRTLPGWAPEIDADTWAQVFLKYVISHPAVTVAIPGTTQPDHARDNVGAMRGRLPDAALRRRMEEFYDSL
jgi:aryl-alcohol dehydrogenase-like predicted oxidoreductase